MVNAYLFCYACLLLLKILNCPCVVLRNIRTVNPYHSTFVIVKPKLLVSALYIIKNASFGNIDFHKVPSVSQRISKLCKQVFVLNGVIKI